MTDKVLPETEWNSDSWDKDLMWMDGKKLGFRLLSFGASQPVQNWIFFSKFTKEKEELRIKKAGELSHNLRFDDFLQNLNRKRTLKLQGLFRLGDLSLRAVKGRRAVHSLAALSSQIWWRRTGQGYFCHTTLFLFSFFSSRDICQRDNCQRS